MYIYEYMYIYHSLKYKKVDEMGRVCSVSSFSVRCNIDHSFTETRRLYQIKSINGYTHREKELG